jgi:diacylglycerol kinase family enzyme
MTGRDLVAEPAPAYHRCHDTLPSYRKVRTFRTRSLEISGPAPVNSEADGELIGATPIRFSLLQRYVKVVVP